jgi:phosphatidylglycerol:prolipoprotein diacylglycerol transferase
VKYSGKNLVIAAFLIGYEVFRFAAGFARRPDDFFGPPASGMSMGEWLWAPIILGGVPMTAWAYRDGRATAGA